MRKRGLRSERESFPSAASANFCQLLQMEFPFSSERQFVRQSVLFLGKSQEKLHFNMKNLNKFSRKPYCT